MPRKKQSLSPSSASLSSSAFSSFSSAFSSSDDLLTTREVARLLHCNPQTIYRMRSRRGSIPYIRVSSRKVLYRRSDVEKWLSQHQCA